MADTPGVQGPINTNGGEYSFNLPGNIDFNLAGFQINKDFYTSSYIQSPCDKDKSAIKGIQKVIQDLQNKLEGIKRFTSINGIIDAIAGEDSAVGKEIKKYLNFASQDIAGFVKNILGKVRGWVLREIGDKVKKVLPFLFPSEVPSFMSKIEKGLDGISCAFAKIIRALASTIGNLLLQLIDKYINGPLCLIEDFIDSLLKQILDPIFAAIKSVLDIINSVLGIAENIIGTISNFLDFVTGILNFFKCDDEKKCPTVNEVWSASLNVNPNLSKDIKIFGNSSSSSLFTTGTPTTSTTSTTSTATPGVTVPLEVIPFTAQ